MKEEYGDEKGIFGRIDAPKWHEGLAGDTQVDRLGDYLANRLEGILEDDKILTDLDSEIKQLSEGELQRTSMSKNMKKIE